MLPTACKVANPDHQPLLARAKKLKVKAGDTYFFQFLYQPAKQIHPQFLRQPAKQL
jgi:hypothetical protein